MDVCREPCTAVLQFCAPLVKICQPCSEICRDGLPDLVNCHQYCPLYLANFGPNATTVDTPHVVTEVVPSMGVLLVKVLVPVAVLVIVSLIVGYFVWKKLGRDLLTEQNNASDTCNDIPNEKPLLSHEDESVPIRAGGPIIEKSSKTTSQGQHKNLSTAQPCSDPSNTDSMVLLNSGKYCDSSVFFNALESSHKTPGQKRKLYEEVSTDAHRFQILSSVDDVAPNPRAVDDKGSPTSSQDVPGPLSNVCASRLENGAMSHRDTSFEFDLRSDDNSPVSRDLGQRRVSASYNLMSTVNRENNWDMVIRMYDIVDSKINVLSYIAGCMIGSEALQVYVRTTPERDLDACYNGLINVLPDEPRVRELLVVLPETSEPPTPDDVPQQTPDEIQPMVMTSSEQERHNASSLA